MHNPIILFFVLIMWFIAQGVCFGSCKVMSVKDCENSSLFQSQDEQGCSETQECALAFCRENCIRKENLMGQLKPLCIKTCLKRSVIDVLDNRTISLLYNTLVIPDNQRLNKNRQTAKKIVRRNQIEPASASDSQQERKAFSLWKKVTQTHLSNATVASDDGDLYKSANVRYEGEEWARNHASHPFYAQPRLTAEILRNWLIAENSSQDSFVQINEHLFNPGCLFVEKSGATGANTESLFLVRYRPSCLYPERSPSSLLKLLFIIKGIPNATEASEIANLHKLQNSQYIRSFSGIRDSEFPQLTFAENFYKYKATDGQNHVFSVLHAAKGKSLFDLVLDKELQASEAFEKLGEVLAHFQMKFMVGARCSLTKKSVLSRLDKCNTISHGDFHLGNIFYDGKYIYYIDLEGMAYSLDEKDRMPFLTDPVHLLDLWDSWKGDISPDVIIFFDYLKEIFLNAYARTLTNDSDLRKKIVEGIKKQNFHNQHLIEKKRKEVDRRIARLNKK